MSRLESAHVAAKISLRRYRGYIVVTPIAAKLESSVIDAKLALLNTRRVSIQDCPNRYVQA